MLKVTSTLISNFKYLTETAPKGFFGQPASKEFLEQKFKEFRDMINGIKTPTTPAMQRGLDFEQEVIDGKHPQFSELVVDSVYQVKLNTTIEIMGEEVFITGVLDFLKCGIIYDAKRPEKYSYGKYNDYQKHFYFLLVPEATEFNYLIGFNEFEYPDKDFNEIIVADKDTGLRYEIEQYFNNGDSLEQLTSVIMELWNWLKIVGLWNDYVRNWTVTEDYLSSQEIL